MNICEILIILLVICYLSFVFKNWNKQESFETTPSPYKDASSYDSIYDDFYSFYHDDLFFQPPYYEQLCKSMLSYINNVYNNHLCIGIKHGGHMNELLKNNMQTKSVSKSKSIVQVCKHHYKDHDYDYIPNVDTNPYVFDENEFTHISLIDNEIYYLSNLKSLFYNCHKWLILKGYLFIPFYNHKEDLKKGFLKVNANSKIRIYSVYTNEFREYSKDSFSLIETIKDHGKERKNKHSLYFYSKEYIEAIAKESQFSLVEVISFSPYESMFVFQKQ